MYLASGLYLAKCALIEVRKRHLYPGRSPDPHVSGIGDLCGSLLSKSNFH